MSALRAASTKRPAQEIYPLSVVVPTMLKNQKPRFDLLPSGQDLEIGKNESCSDFDIDNADQDLILTLLVKRIQNRVLT